MNATIHSTMLQALKGFIPPAQPVKPDGLPNKQTIVPAGLYEYQYQDGDGLVLDCHLEYEAGHDGGTGPDSDESYPESISLIYALVNGVDIASVLNDGVTEEIEAEALANMEMDGWDNDYDMAADQAEERSMA